MRLKISVLGLLAFPAVVLAQATNPGANTRAYVSVNQVQTPGCATSGFLGGAHWSPDAHIVCSGATYSGSASDVVTAGSITTQTHVTANNMILANFASNNSARSLVALSRAAYQDALFVSSTGLTPASVRFNFLLNGTVSGFAGTNTGITHTANFGVSFGTLVPTVTQGVVLPNGAQSRTVGYDAAWVDGFVPLTTEFLNFANIFATDNNGAPITGSSSTEYTLTLANVQFLDAQGNDISGSVNAHFRSGANYNVAPEPASLALLGTGLVGVGAMVRRRRQRA